MHLFKFISGFHWANAILLPALVLTIAGCASHRPMEPIEYLDLDKFMGDWYVIANIPTPFEKGAHNAVETYELNDKGNIEVSFRFRADSFDGKLKKYHPKGFVRDKKSNAVWGMQFIWPFKSDYRIVYLSADASQVIIGRLARDFVWLMARDPKISDEDYQTLKAKVSLLGYDTSKLLKIPQQWPE